MVWLKRVNNSESGDATHWGGDDVDNIDKYFDNTDISGSLTNDTIINTPTSYRDEILKILNSDETASYSIKAGTISSDQTLTLPDLDGTGTLVAAGGANDWGEALQTFRSSYLSLRNPANSNSYIFVTSAIAGNRNITLPLLTTNDEFLMKSFAQTPTNKTIEINNNTLKHSTTNAQGDLLKYDEVTGKYIRVPIGTANQVLHVKSDASDIEWAAESGSLEADKIAVYEGGVQVGSVARKLNFNSAHFNVTEDAGNDELDIDLVDPGGGSGEGNATTLFKNTTTVSVTNVDTETNILDTSITGGTIGTNGMLHIVVGGYYLNDSGSDDSFAMKLKLGATTLWQDQSATISDATLRRPFSFEFWVKNMNSASAQRTFGRYSINSDHAGDTGFSDFGTDELVASGNLNGAETTVDTGSTQSIVLSITHDDAHADIRFVADVVFCELIDS